MWQEDAGVKRFDEAEDSPFAGVFAATEALLAAAAAVVVVRKFLTT
jgi:hypothetical protein